MPYLRQKSLDRRALSRIATYRRHKAYRLSVIKKFLRVILTSQPSFGIRWHSRDYHEILRITFSMYAKYQPNDNAMLVDEQSSIPGLVRSATPNSSASRNTSEGPITPPHYACPLPPQHYSHLSEYLNPGCGQPTSFSSYLSQNVFPAYYEEDIPMTEVVTDKTSEYIGSSSTPISWREDLRGEPMEDIDDCYTSINHQQWVAPTPASLYEDGLQQSTDATAETQLSNLAMLIDSQTMQHPDGPALDLTAMSAEEPSRSPFSQPLDAQPDWYMNDPYSYEDSLPSFIESVEHNIQAEPPQPPQPTFEDLFIYSTEDRSTPTILTVSDTDGIAPLEVNSLDGMTESDATLIVSQPISEPMQTTFDPVQPVADPHPAYTPMALAVVLTPSSVASENQLTVAAQTPTTPTPAAPTPAAPAPAAPAPVAPPPDLSMLAGVAMTRPRVELMQPSSSADDTPMPEAEQPGSESDPEFEALLKAGLERHHDRPKKSLPKPIPEERRRVRKPIPKRKEGTVLPPCPTCTLPPSDARAPPEEPSEVDIALELTVPTNMPKLSAFGAEEQCAGEAASTESPDDAQLSRELEHGLKQIPSETDGTPQPATSADERPRRAGRDSPRGRHGGVSGSRRDVIVSHASNVASLSASPTSSSAQAASTQEIPSPAFAAVAPVIDRKGKGRATEPAAETAPAEETRPTEETQRGHTWPPAHVRAAQSSSSSLAGALGLAPAPAPASAPVVVPWHVGTPTAEGFVFGNEAFEAETPGQHVFQVQSAPQTLTNEPVASSSSAPAPPAYSYSTWQL